MSALLERLYARSPTWLQTLGLNAYAIMWRHRRFGGGFARACQGYRDRERFTAEEWASYQTGHLRELLARAVETVPYYRELADSCGLNAAALSRFSLRDLARLPLLDKQTLRTDPDPFLNRCIPRRLLHPYLTSGTTGTPVSIYYTTDMHRQWSAAYEARVRNWAGVTYRHRRAMIGGRQVVPKAVASPPYWRHNWAESQLYLSAFHISPSTAPHYAVALSAFRPHYLVGYASSHYFLARFFAEQRLRVPPVQAVLTSSEKLTPEMRETIEMAYACRVYDAYSGVEACCLASECSHHRLHISPDIGIVEIVDAHGRPCKPGEAGEIVATGLLNTVQPLVRYRTGDWASLSMEPCPCGRAMPVLTDLVGRLEDTVIGPDGRELVRFHGLYVGLPSIREGQVVQESLHSFTLRLVVDPCFGSADRATIRRRFEDRLGPVELTFALVDAIERTERGKFRAVISKVPRRAVG